MNQLVPEARTIVRLEVQADEVAGIYAACINCNKRFTSIRSVSTHLKGTANRHAVCFYNHGNYDKKTGLRTNIYAN
ncbi:MAG: hypothetical protein WBE68_18690 [Candidatus Nitrosopolaris sp.]